MKNFPLNEFTTIKAIGAKNTTTNAQSIINIILSLNLIFFLGLLCIETAFCIIVLPPYF